MTSPTPIEAATPHEEARLCAAHLRLSLDRRSWKGGLGNWAGAGVGSSIDFQDHRPYVPGDDPRHIDWAAYARSGQTIMKLYREEVSPRLDLVLDGSASMSLTPEKQAQTHRLFLFCVESALAVGTSLRMVLLTGGKAEALDIEAVRHPSWSLPATESRGEIPDLSRVPFRGGSLRILISDLLFTVPPVDVLTPMGVLEGGGMVFAPYDPREEAPDWGDNMELIDCERGTSRRQRVDDGLLKTYRAAYARHIAAWQDTALRYRIRFARVRAGIPLTEALTAEALKIGAVETWG
jgi:uncharacterized protein (DUF58 family)